jgi:hypothetical protein
VLVEANDLGPGILALASLELQVPIERRVQESRRAPKVAPDLFKVGVSLAGAKQRATVALGVSSAFTDAR